jgi:hypothetical protein
MKHLGVMLAAALGNVIFAQSNIDTSQKFAWCENVGWTNWHDSDEGVNGVHVGLQFLAGFIWSENAGWINAGDGTPQASCGGRPCYANFDGADFGVNLDEDGSVHGLVWGENIGWINFDTFSPEEGGAHFDACERRFLGFAWSENIGWINLGGDKDFVGVGPCGFADIDCDGNIASDDYAAFPSRFNGPDVTEDCPHFDSDADGDVDLLDFAAFQIVFSE